MKAVIDIEADGLDHPKNIWVIVCIDADTDETYIFREVTSNETERARFLEFAQRVDTWIGHNCIGYDLRVLNLLLGQNVSDNRVLVDTLIVSKLVNYSRGGQEADEGPVKKNKHSLRSYGVEFGLNKGDFDDFSKYSTELEDYCRNDARICLLIYQRYLDVISDPLWEPALTLEHNFQWIVNSLHENGFYFDKKKAEGLLDWVLSELKILDADIAQAFPPRLVLVREITPTLTKHGTLHKKDFKWVKDGDLSVFNGGPFSLCSWKEFNPASPKQVVEVLNKAGWKPEQKTKTHIEVEREINRLKFSKSQQSRLDLTSEVLDNKYNELKVFGWKINEDNLDTLPQSAPSAARSLAKRILLESRRRTLLEWLSLVQEDGRIHGEYQGIGAWTQRMSHQNPNTANIPSEFSLDGSLKLLGKEMRQLWRAPRNRLLVGVDAEAIQLRIFAHYINDPEFTDALVRGRKEDKSDPHSLNQRILGSVCKSRAASKRFIFALLLGAGLGKLAEILDSSRDGAQEALDRILDRYRGFARLKQETIPTDANLGYFTGLDGRKVLLPGNSERDRAHLCMSGYLQNGEAVVMKKACLLWHAQVKDEFKFVNFVHDEWQTEVANNMQIALRVAKIQADALKTVGEELKLNCPLAGSFYNEDHKDYTIGPNWYTTH